VVVVNSPIPPLPLPFQLAKDDPLLENMGDSYVDPAGDSAIVLDCVA